MRGPVVNKYVKCFAIIDEQSDSSFIHPALIDQLKIKSKFIDYTITTLSQLSTRMSGRTARGLTVKGFREDRVFKLPELLEAAFIPDSTSEVCTREDAQGIPALKPFADKFLPEKLGQGARVLMLLGRNNSQIIYTETHSRIAPIIHEMPLGWCSVGESHPSGVQEVRNTSSFLIREGLSSQPTFPATMPGRLGFLPEAEDPLFQLLENDEQESLSREDIDFLKVMNEGLRINSEGRIQAPLPFKGGKEPLMPDNSRAVYGRQLNHLRSYQKDPVVGPFAYEAMGRNIANGYVERIPEAELQTEEGRRWYIPIFVAKNKKGKLRVVFDSAAKFGPEGHQVCLNQTLMAGPDRNNQLRDVLLRFREGSVGFMADVEAMFHQFKVDPVHCDYLRFYWNEDNDPSRPLVPFRATVHIFGNTSSPAISKISFNTTTEWAKPKPEPEVKRYLASQFYVDDGCGAAPDANSAIAILKGARATLQQFGIRLHKIISSDETVLKAFPPSEIAKDVAQIDFAEEDVLMQKSLGVAWDIKTDRFVVKVSVPNRAFSKRGVLSVVNSIYDPIGMATPCSLAGRLFQRSILPKKGQGSEEIETLGWDDELPSHKFSEWQSYVEKLNQLEKLTMPRSLVPGDFGTVVRQEIHAFADSSQEAIGWVLYCRSVNAQDKVHVAFLTSGSKVGPQAATTIPRMELNAALQCAIATQSVRKAMGRPPDETYFYSDSKCVLGYLTNAERRFSRYVTRRVGLILNLSKDWQYIGTDINPADIASRPATPRQLLRSKWLTGPDFLWKSRIEELHPFQEPSPDELPEELPDTKVLVTRRADEGPLDSVFVRISRWTRALGIAARVQDVIKKCRGVDELDLTPTEFLVREAQKSEYPEVISLLEREQPLPEDHPLLDLSPMLHKGLIRVGGRLDRSSMVFDRRHPMLIPKGHALATLVISHFHSLSQHQGRHLTHAQIIQNGFHVESGKKLIKQFLSNCVVCKKLRSKLSTQKMSDLPTDRIERCPPFANCGLDVAGPWYVVQGRATRQNPGKKKIWIVLFTCLASRAISVELIDSLSTPSFKNALSRFLDKNGACRRIRSDRGRNFVGAQPDEVKEDELPDVEELKDAMGQKGVEWLFNPPYAHHFGGAWERKIGSLRRVLEGTLATTGKRTLTREELETFVWGAVAVVNSTPLWEISPSPDDPMPLTPAMLLTLRDSPHPPPPEDFTEDDLLAYGKLRWRRTQFLIDEFWRRWYDEYLHNLQKRSKWFKINKNLKPGDVILLRDKTAPRNDWPLGRVVSVKKSEDNLVRSCDVVVMKTSPNGTLKSYTYTRPIHELVYISSPEK